MLCIGQDQSNGTITVCVSVLFRGKLGVSSFIRAPYDRGKDLKDMDRGLYTIIILYVIDTRNGWVYSNFGCSKASSIVAKSRSSKRQFSSRWCGLGASRSAFRSPSSPCQHAFNARMILRVARKIFYLHRAASAISVSKKSRFPLPLRNAREAPCVTFHAAPRLYLETG